MKNNIKTPKTNKSQTLDSFKTIMNPTTGKMVQSGGQLGKKLIKDYKADTIYNPLTKKYVKTGGSVGKKILSMYRGGAAPTTTAQPPTQITEKTFYENFNVLYNKSNNHPSTRSALAFIWFLQYIKTHKDTYTHTFKDTILEIFHRNEHQKYSIWHPRGKLSPEPKFDKINKRTIAMHEDVNTIKKYIKRITCKYTHTNDQVNIKYTYAFNTLSSWKDVQIINANFQYNDGILTLEIPDDNSNDRSQSFFYEVQNSYNKISYKNDSISEDDCWSGPLKSFQKKVCGNQIQFKATNVNIENDDILKTYITYYQIITMLIYTLLTYIAKENIDYYALDNSRIMFQGLATLDSQLWLPELFQNEIDDLIKQNKLI